MMDIKVTGKDITCYKILYRRDNGICTDINKRQDYTEKMYDTERNQLPIGRRRDTTTLCHRQDKDRGKVVRERIRIKKNKAIYGRISKAYTLNSNTVYFSGDILEYDKGNLINFTLNDSSVFSVHLEQFDPKTCLTDKVEMITKEKYNRMLSKAVEELNEAMVK